MKPKKLSLVIPAYNEEASISNILDKIISLKWPLEIELIIVNDCSKDKTAQVLAKYTKHKFIKILTNQHNQGKSQSVRSGLMQTSGDLVVIQDADLEYNPNDLVSMVKIFTDEDVDVIYGNRFGKNNKIVYFSNWLGNRGLSFLSSIFTGLRAGMWVVDMETCYKMIKGEIIREIAPRIVSKTNFGFEPEITARLSKFKVNGKHLKFRQIPIDYYPRTIAQGKKMRGFSDGYKALKEIIRFNLANEK